MFDSKNEMVKCPCCGMWDRQIIEFRDGAPFPSYIAECCVCGYIITESEWESLSEGDWVRHPDHGTGVVVSVSGMMGGTIDSPRLDVGVLVHGWDYSGALYDNNSDIDVLEVVNAPENVSQQGSK